MNIRLVAAFVLTCFFIPWCYELAKFNIDGIAKLYGVIGYVLLIGYLLATCHKGVTNA